MVHEIVAMLFFHHAASYDRRIAATLTRLPFTLLFLVKSPAGDRCDVRTEIGRSLLDASDHSLDIVSLKIKKLFLDELEECVASGSHYS